MELAAAPEAGSGEPEDLIARVIGALTGDGQEDDVAILAVRFATGEADQEAPDSSALESLTLTDPAPPAYTTTYVTAFGYINLHTSSKPS